MKTFDEVNNALAISKSLRQLTTNLGYTVGGANVNTVKKMLIVYGLPLPTGHRRGKTIPLIEALVVNSPYVDTKNLKQRLLKAGILINVCVVCGATDTWMGLPLTLQMDHINGDCHDNRIENLRILCPNCHTQTPTWGMKARTRRGLHPLPIP